MAVTKYSLYLAIVGIAASFEIHSNCENSTNKLNSSFYLITPFHRSQAERLYVANVNSLASCIQLAKTYKGLALNYSPQERFVITVSNSKTNRDHYWEQPQLFFNCHVLNCPENRTFKTLVNDSQFDYYSLYEKALALTHYICIPQVGIFVFNDIRESFQNASLRCQSIGDGHCGSLAHIVSAARTTSLKQAIINYNEEQSEFQIKPQIHLAYIGLHFNRTQHQQRFQIVTNEGDKLQCFSYRAWEPGNPKRSSQFRNSSCVALTSHGTWLTIDCTRKLPYFCEVFTMCQGD